MFTHTLIALFLVFTSSIAETISFKKNTWNFVGFAKDIKVIEDPFLNSPKVKILWTYSNKDTKQWAAYSHNVQLQKNLSLYRSISTIYSHEGAWVYPTQNFQYIQKTSYIDKDEDAKKSLSKGWNLLSSSNAKKIYVEDLDNTNIVFVYRDNEWFTFPNIGQSYKTLESIKPTEAYWLYTENINTMIAPQNTSAISFPTLPNREEPSFPN